MSARITIVTLDTTLQEIAGQIVGDIVAADYRAASVFDKFGIDFCCEGQRSVDQACREKGVDLNALLQELEQVEEASGTVERHDQWALDFLADYIVNQFHVYTRDMFPRINDYMDAVVNAHGDTHPELHTLATLWPELRGQLAMHMQKEELMLFPYVKRMLRSQADGSIPKPPPFGTAKELVDKMEAEHDDTGNVLAQMEQISGGYAPPEDACPSYRTLYGYLKEFDAATKKHVHLENNILFPKSIRLEESFRAG